MSAPTSTHRGTPRATSLIDSYSNGPKQDMIHAAEVLASFNQYPIKQTTGAYPGASQSRTNISPGSSRKRLTNDPLLQDIQAHSKELVSALIPILQKQEGDPGTNLDINNCKGVEHVQGSMMPRVTEENMSKLSSPTSSSSISSVGYGQPMQFPFHQHIQQSPLVKNEPLPQSPVKENSGFKTTFQFVVNENAKEARNTVRKHVMKEFRRRERWEQGQKGTTKSPIEKKPAARKKRRRARQDTPSDTEQQTPTEPLVPVQYPTMTPAQSRRESQSQPITFPTSEINFEHTHAAYLDSANYQPEPNTAIVSSTNKKKFKYSEPVFAESREHQLWGAVTSGFDDAILELESNNQVGPYQDDPWAGVAVSHVDPFTRLNMDLGPATQSLLHHFAWVMPSLMDSIVTGKTFNRIGWLYSAVAVHDPTPVHVILGYTLGHIAMLRGLEEPPQALEHKSKAIKLLHHRMTDPEQCYSDDLIGAIVNFAGWELICADPKAYAMHMSGLKRIVTARGGMSAFASKTELETVIIRLDAIRAYVTQSSPRYPGFASVRELEPVAINIPHRPNISTWSSPPTNQTYTPVEYRYCEDALTLMNTLEDVLLLARSAASDLSGPVGEPFRKLLLRSMEQLLAKPAILSPPPSSPPSRYPTDLYASYTSPSPPSPSLPSSERSHLSKSLLAIRLAALALLDAAIREFFDSPPYAGYYTQQLKHQFLGSKALANDSPWGRSLEMLIAVLLQADRMALERPWRAWYAADSLTLTMRLSASTWEAVGERLRAWVMQGGLANGNQNSRGTIDLENKSTSDDETMKPRSSTVWNLKDIATKFLKDWDEEEPVVNSPTKNNHQSNNLNQPHNQPSRNNTFPIVREGFSTTASAGGPSSTGPSRNNSLPFTTSASMDGGRYVLDGRELHQGLNPW